MQNFAKSLLDVADNLGRASSAAKESFSKIDASKDAAGAVQQLKTLLEGVEMTEKQLTEVLKFLGSSFFELIFCICYSGKVLYSHLLRVYFT